MAKIPTELYICVPRRSARGAFRTNIWANLTRKDTGEGLGSKKLLSFLDGVNVSALYTTPETGYAGPFDINPKTEGLHTTHIQFEGDSEFEACKSEEVTLKIDPNLLGAEIKMEATPISGIAPLTIQVTGTVKAIRPDGARIPLEHSVPLDLMVFDSTSTRRLQTVKTVEAIESFNIDCTFTKLGTYAIFVNFLGDNKYASAWSNNGRTTTITVQGGELPLSFEKTITVTAKQTLPLKWILSQTEPTPPEGYERFPDLDLDFGVLGIYWCFIKA